MVINEGLSEAIDNFENSNLLSFARSLSLLLAETAKNKELCDYIAENGEKVNLKKELSDYFKSGTFKSDQPRVTLPFLFTVLYLLDMKKLSIEDILQYAYPRTEIDAGYYLFVRSVSKTVYQCIDNVNNMFESADLAPDNDISETHKSFLYLKKYVSAFCDETTAAEIYAATDYLYSALKTKNSEYISGLYNKLENLISTADLDSACLNGIKKAISDIDDSKD